MKPLKEIHPHGIPEDLVQDLFNLCIHMISADELDQPWEYLDMILTALNKGSHYVDRTLKDKYPKGKLEPSHRSH